MKRIGFFARLLAFFGIRRAPKRPAFRIYTPPADDILSAAILYRLLKDSPRLSPQAAA